MCDALGIYACIYVLYLGTYACFYDVCMYYDLLIQYSV